MNQPSKVRHMTTYPSGLTSPLPERGQDAAAWGRHLALAIDDQPLGQCAPCLNPECVGPVDYVPGRGPALLYCSTYCRNRTFALRQRLTQQLHIIDTALGSDYARVRGLPRDELRDRARHLRWWLARLTPAHETADETTL